MVSQRTADKMGIILIATIIGLSIMMFYKAIDNRTTVHYDQFTELLEVKVQF